jgi:hypothetical protein
MNTAIGQFGSYGRSYGVAPVLVSTEEQRKAEVRLGQRFGEKPDRIEQQYDVDLAVCKAETPAWQVDPFGTYQDCRAEAYAQYQQALLDQEVYALATPFRMREERQAKREKQEQQARRAAREAAEAAELAAAQPAVSPYLLIGGAVLVVGGLTWWLTRKAA